MRGEAYLIRYLDDFVMCFQYRSDAESVHRDLKKRGKLDDMQIER